MGFWGRWKAGIGRVDRLLIRSMDGWRYRLINRYKQQEEPIGAPAPGHIRVAVKAIGLNLADVFAIIGLYSATPKG